MKTGDYMEEPKELNRLELFYDVFDESNNILYEATHAKYFDLIIMTAKNILSGEVLNDIDDLDVKRLRKVYKKLDGVDFSSEDVRKAMQSITLRGFKEMRFSNGGTTPDTVGIITAYLISRFEKNSKKSLRILDPLAGVGNYLFTVFNHLDCEMKLFAADNKEKMTEVLKAIADLMDTPVEIYLQDTLNLRMKDMNYIIFDMPISDIKEEKYFPYLALSHYVSLLSEEGIMIGLVSNDFFNHDKDGKWKDEFYKDMRTLMLLELPESMFISNPKSIVVFKKTDVDVKALTLNLPSFTDVKEFNKSLMTIENWFQNNLEK